MKKGIKRGAEKLIESSFFISSFSTTIAVLLIVVFIFGEGIKLFNQKPMEEGMALVLSQKNPVNNISTSDICKVFDGDITSWKHFSSLDQDIQIVRIDDLGNYFSEEELGANFEYIPQKINQLMDENSNFIGFFPEKQIPKNFAGKVIKIDKVKLGEFLSGSSWLPTATPVAQLGVYPLIMGTLWVSLGAILFALPFGLATAIFLAEIARPKVRSAIKPIIELLAGIPSVVYGFFGLVVIVPMVQKTFDLPVGESGLVGSIILGIMALPTIISISEDALRNTPKEMKEASLALGANHWQTIFRVVIPHSISGISAAVILGMGRAIGETMAVLMVTGNAGVIPHTLLEPLRTIPATIAAELGEAPQGGTHFHALFALGAILFLITMFINLVVEFFTHRNKFKKVF